MEDVMKLKKLVALLVAGMMVFSVTGCGTSGDGGSNPGSGTQTGETQGEQRLVVWTLANDLKQFADRYMEQNPNVKIETVVIEPAQYLTKVQSALMGNQKEPDVIVAEPQMLDSMMEAGFFEDLNQAPYNAQEYADQIVDYVWEVGQDDDGVQRAISYQITPAGIYYRRDIAKEVFGTEDPAEISKLFASYDKILETGYTLKDAGYRVFASDGEMTPFSGHTPWVIDGKLNVDQARIDFMDLSVKLYEDDLTAYASQWSAPWYTAMKGEIPILTAETNVWDEAAVEEQAALGGTTEVFAYGLPSWGVLIMRDNVGDTSGLWGVAEGPSAGFGGGTYIGISSNSQRKDLAWDFVQFATLNGDTMEWWLEASQGDTVSHIPTLEKHKETPNEVYGGQNLYHFWLEQAEKIDYSIVTEYDTEIGNAWGAAISSIKTGEMTKEAAIEEFYKVVAATYPELVIEK